MASQVHEKYVLNIMEMQIKTTIWYHVTQDGYYQKTWENSVGKDVERM